MYKALYYIDVYIFDCLYFKLYNIGISGKFPLPLYNCALSIVTLDLIYCIYTHFLYIKL